MIALNDDAQLETVMTGRLACAGREASAVSRMYSPPTGHSTRDVGAILDKYLARTTRSL